MFLGFLIAVYLLASRKLFGAQAKLLLYGIFPNKWAKIIEEEVHYTDKMFNGFFVGKIIDSAIIGLIVLCGNHFIGIRIRCIYQCCDRSDEHYSVFRAVYRCNPMCIITASGK